MAECTEHKVVKGLVDRSRRENGMVLRKRRCDVCGELMRTTEMTDDQLAFIKEKFESVNRALRAEMIQLKSIVDAVRRIHDMEKRVKGELEKEYEYKEEDPFK